MKIFNLSLHRTATQSFDLFMATKLKSIHFVKDDFDFSFKNEEELWGKYKSIYIDMEYTAFSDFPIPIFLDKLINEFTDSKFIFFKRDKNSWISSVKKHKQHPTTKNTLLIDDIFYQKYVGKNFIDTTDEDLSKAYDLYYNNIKSYGEKILCLNLEDNPKYISEKISEYLNIRFEIDFPLYDFYNPDTKNIDYNILNKDKKNLLVTISSNYSYENIYAWIATAEKHCVNTDIVIFINKNDRNTIKQITKNHKKIKLVLINRKYKCICVERLEYYSDYIDDNLNKYSYALMVDIRDAFFQSDPFKYIANCKKDIIVNEEPIPHRLIPWCYEMFEKMYNKEVMEKFMDRPVYCAGVVGGKAKELSILCRQIYNESIRVGLTNIDQHLLNYFIHTDSYKNNVFFGTEKMPFATHLNTQRGFWREQHTSYKDEEMILPLATLRDNKVINSDGEEFAIVHQYDRVTEWLSIVKTQFMNDGSLLIAEKRIGV